MTGPSDHDGPRFYGRRRGRPLRAGRRELLEQLLPHLSVEPGDAPVDLDTLFGRRYAAYELEIGFGAGEHLAAQAAANPDRGFVGCEAFINGVARLLAHIEDGNIGNIRIWPDDARPLFARLPEAAFSRIHLLFPDPWPKARHAARRMISPEVLDVFARLLADGGELRVASDDQGYIRWTLRHLLTHPDFSWTAAGPNDWRRRPADWPPTRYEEKAVGKGIRPAYLRFRRRPRGAESP